MDDEQLATLAKARDIAKDELEKVEPLIQELLTFRKHLRFLYTGTAALLGTSYEALCEDPYSVYYRPPVNWNRKTAAGRTRGR